MESAICFRILTNRNFGDIEIKISKCNIALEQPGIFHFSTLLLFSYIEQESLIHMKFNVKEPL